MSFISQAAQHPHAHRHGASGRMAWLGQRLSHCLRTGATATCLALAMAAPLVHAAPLRFTAQADLQSWDIHALNVLIHNSVHGMVYESLVAFDSSTLALTPVLATGWSNPTPLQWRFALRQGVQFQDGSSFGADDVVFSLKRAMAKGSAYLPYARGITQVTKVDDYTVDVFTDQPRPVLLRQLTMLRIMSQAWATKHQAQRPQTLPPEHELYSHRNAMGTGPYTLLEWKAEQYTRLRSNPRWWGHAAGRRSGNVDSIEFLPLLSPAARTAALLSGAVDLVLDPALQDIRQLERKPQLQVLNGPENRTVMLGMRHARKPFSDERVRKAIYQALDIDSLIAHQLNRLVTPSGTIVAPMINGWSADNDQRLAFEPDEAMRLLKDAGYTAAQPLTLQLVCPNDRHSLDTTLCTAIAAMWKRAGIHTKMASMPIASYVTALRRGQGDVYLMGWGVPTLDAQYTLRDLVHSKGEFNFGQFSDQAIDRLIERSAQELDGPVRQSLLHDALKSTQSKLAYVPLFNQTNPWAMRRGIQVVHRPDNILDVTRIQISEPATAPTKTAP